MLSRAYITRQCYPKPLICGTCTSHLKRHQGPEELITQHVWYYYYYYVIETEALMCVLVRILFCQLCISVHPCLCVY